MSYQEKHSLRKKVIKIAKQICPKIQINESEYQLYIPLRKKSWRALDILDVARQTLEQVQQMGLKEVRTPSEDEQENQFLYAGSGVEVYVELSREGVDLFLHEVKAEVQ